MAGIEFKEIANRLTCEEFARRELPMKGNRAKCPFHNGENYNLKFFPDGKCYCHKCHKSGDVVTLAAATWHVSQMDAAQTLNRQYNLGVSDGGPDPAIMKQRQLEQAARDAERQEQERRWLDGCTDLLAALDAYHAALTEKEHADMNTPEGTAAEARFKKAESRLGAVWFDMTGYIFPDDDNDDNDDGVFIDLLTGQVQTDVG